MDSGLRQEILSMLKAAGEMTVATVRADGYPQATTVNYVSDGFLIYFGCAAESQKVQNIACNDKVSFSTNPPIRIGRQERRLSGQDHPRDHLDPRLPQRVWPHRFSKNLRWAPLRRRAYSSTAASASLEGGGTSARRINSALY